MYSTMFAYDEHDDVNLVREYLTRFKREFKQGLASGTPGSHGLTGGVYKARERIHRAVADARLLANPASWSRVADSSPN